MSTTTKPTNPKDVVGIKKSYRSVVPLPVLHELGLAMLEGALKYGRHNYRVDGVRASTYIDAVARHLDAWWEGEDTDKDSQLSHITKAIACLVVLRDSMMFGNYEDDRPPRHDVDWMQVMNNGAAALIEEYPEPKPAFTEKDNGKRSD